MRTDSHHAFPFVACATLQKRTQKKKSNKNIEIWHPYTQPHTTMSFLLYIFRCSFNLQLRRIYSSSKQCERFACYVCCHHNSHGQLHTIPTFINQFGHWCVVLNVCVCVFFSLRSVSISTSIFKRSVYFQFSTNFRFFVVLVETIKKLTCLSSVLELASNSILHSCWIPIAFEMQSGYLHRTIFNQYFCNMKNTNDVWRENMAANCRRE